MDNRRQEFFFCVKFFVLTVSVLVLLIWTIGEISAASGKSRPVPLRAAFTKGNCLFLEDTLDREWKVGIEAVEVRIDERLPGTYVETETLPRSYIESGAGQPSREISQKVIIWVRTEWQKDDWQNILFTARQKAVTPRDVLPEIR